MRLLTTVDFFRLPDFRRARLRSNRQTSEVSKTSEVWEAPVKQGRAVDRGQALTARADLQ